MTLWKVFPGEDFAYEVDFLERAHVGISFGFARDLREFDSEDDIKQQHDNQPGVLWRFCHELERGDLVAVPLSQHRINVGSITGDYVFREEDPHHIRAIHWHAVDLPDAEFGEELVKSIRSPSTFHRVNVEGGRERVMELSSRWIDLYLKRAQTYFDSGQLDSQELHYKHEMIEGLGRARSALFADDPQWPALVRKALSVQGSPMTWRSGTAIYSWFDSAPDEARDAMRAFWSDDDNDQWDIKRIRRLVERIPESNSFRRSEIGMTLRTVSALLMALGPDHPPFTKTSYELAYQATHRPRPRRGADPGVMYAHALAFLDRLIDRATALSLERPADRLEAQSLIWIMYQDSAQAGQPDEQEDQLEHQPPSLAALADELLLPLEFLETVQRLLDDKRQVIFQGPPGTGKTFVAKRLVEHLAGAAERVRLVQFHPSYAYEDFVQGYRPALDDQGRATFTLRDGPLVELATRALNDPEHDHFLVIDEINRGNLAKILGELYFLLEYRNEAIQLQYSDALFRLPRNLRIIGTMNTADRSIALVDLALRRRFHFVEFHPDTAPIKGLLHRWLSAHAPELLWVAEVVDLANEKLEAREAAVGPSYFMKAGRTEQQVELTWNHNVLPYIEEQLYGEPDRLREFGLDVLRAELKVGADAVDPPVGAGGDDADD
ncbi:MAG: AAA family ATPase [Chloroflexota bacterium]|nr:AAA family ATPase [Chloroflexota bacterium]